MQNSEIIGTIDKAKDSYGMITHDAMQDQLRTLTAADWRQASQVFSKDAAKQNGPYIEDDANGNVTIHHDTSQAQEFVNKSLVDNVVDDAKAVALPVLGLAAGAAGLHALFEMGGACVGDSYLALAATGAETGLAIYGGLIACVGVGVVALAAGAEYVKKDSVRNELSRDSTVSFNLKGHE
jgi:hypothetical protein